MLKTLTMALVLCCLAGCRGAGAEIVPLPTPASAAPLQVSSSSLMVAGDGFISERYTCDGLNVSLPLAWSGLPPSTKSVLIVFDDPDAPDGQFIHWIVWDVSPEARPLFEGAGLSGDASVLGGGRQGLNSYGIGGYGSPCPPHGRTHAYAIHVYALDEPLGLQAGAEARAVLQAVDPSRVVGHGVLTGSYRRK
ncbi:MAG: YbhB/YbcL family Raf kinase inhibitor-like protein [SAR202 cluster bacterium]|nr:YbhB/YbcL family Raf kinase inhibitor-like protein [SAR202 cluster bacterium]